MSAKTTTQIEVITDDRVQDSDTLHLLDHWAYLGDVPVAYARTMHQPSAFMLVLTDIETRPGYRGQGFAAALIDALETQYGLTLHATGDYTPEGYAALNARLPLAPGAPEADITTPPTTFVASWDDHTVNTPLD